MDYKYDAGAARQLLVEAFSGYNVHRSEFDRRRLGLLSQASDELVVKAAGSALDDIFSDPRNSPRTREVFETAAGLVDGRRVERHGRLFKEIAEEFASRGSPLSANWASTIYHRGMRKMKYEKVREKLESILLQK